MRKVLAVVILLSLLFAGCGSRGEYLGKIIELDYEMPGWWLSDPQYIIHTDTGCLIIVDDYEFKGALCIGASVYKYEGGCQWQYEIVQEENNDG